MQNNLKRRKGEIIMANRKGIGKGKGMGFKNLIPKDPYTHSMNARGVKSLQRPVHLYAEGEVQEVDEMLEELQEQIDEEPQESSGFFPAPTPDILINESGEGDVHLHMNGDDTPFAPTPDVLMNSNLEADPDIVEEYEREELAQETGVAGFFPELEYVDVDRVPEKDEPTLLPSLTFEAEVSVDKSDDDTSVPLVPLPTVLIPEEETFAQKVGKGIKDVGQRGIQIVKEKRSHMIAQKQELHSLTDNELRTMAIREGSSFFGGGNRYEKELLRRETKNKELKDRIKDIRTKKVEKTDSGDSPFGFITAPFETLGATGKKGGKR